jgi:hypothetical protein
VQGRSGGCWQKESSIVELGETASSGWFIAQVCYNDLIALTSGNGDNFKIVAKYLTALTD